MKVRRGRYGFWHGSGNKSALGGASASTPGAQREGIWRHQQGTTTWKGTTTTGIPSTAGAQPRHLDEGYPFVLRQEVEHIIAKIVRINYRELSLGEESG